MARTKGSENKNSTIRPLTCEMSDEERLQLVANLIVDRILHDQQKNKAILKQLSRGSQQPCQIA